MKVITDTSALTMNAEDFHCFRSDPLVRWRGIADVLEARPEAWEWALANIERWLAQGRLHPAPLLEWQQQLLEGRNERTRRDALLEALRIPTSRCAPGPAPLLLPLCGRAVPRSVPACAAV